MKFLDPIQDAAFNDAIIYEEYKGNFSQTKKRATAAVRQLPGEDVTRLAAQAAYIEGVISLLGGEPAKAMEYLEKCYNSSEADSDLLLRALAHNILAEMWRFNLFPDRAGANGVEIAARWDGNTFWNKYQPLQEEFFRKAASAKADYTLLAHLLTGLQSQRSVIQSMDYRSEMFCRQILDSFLQSIATIQSDLKYYHAPSGWNGYALWACADLCKRARRMEMGQDFLNQALAVYSENDDAAGQALCHMTWGDWRCAPFSSPLVWNFSVQEGNSFGSDLAWTTEAAEFNLDGADVPAALQDYQRAEIFFKQAQAPRGLAQLYLRYGYLAMIQNDFVQAKGHIQQAIQYALDTGDGFAYYLALAHQLLARVGTGTFSDLQPLAEETGVWGAGAGSYSYALGLGLFIGRAGRHWLIRRGDAERSLACYRLAESLYKSLGATFNAIKSVVDQGAVYQTIGDRKTALTLYEQSLDMLTLVISQSTALAGSLSPTFIMLANQVYQLYLQELEADGMERCARRLSDQKVLSATEGVEKIALFTMIKTTVEQAQVLVPFYRGKHARDNGDLSQADRFFNQALMATNDLEENKSWLQAVVYGQMRQYDSARQAFQHYMELGGVDAGSMGQLAAVLKSAGGEGGEQEARQQYRRTLEQALSFHVRIKAYDSAKEFLDQLDKIAGPDWQCAGERPWLDLSDCGELYEGLKDYSTALEYYDKAITALEERRHLLSRDELKTALAADQGAQYLYFQAARAACRAAEKNGGMAKNDDAFVEKAFNYAERAKARALLDLMAANAVFRGRFAAENPALKRWRELNAQINAWRGLSALERGKSNADAEQIDHISRQIAAGSDELERIEAELIHSVPGFYQTVRTQAPILSRQDVQRRLARGSLLIKYYFLQDDFLAWAIPSSGDPVSHHSLQDEKAINRMIAAFHRSCRNPRSD
ncbi:hypothetical protein JW998_11335 [candidate division KSB1 bacterium]|nr:hypothetical protein [candidate division KSB1 bacterium]